VRGVRDYTDAFEKGKDRDAIVGIIGPPLKVAPELFTSMQNDKALFYFNPDGAVDTVPLKPFLDFWTQQSLLKTPTEPAALVDNSYTQGAIAKLGKYQR
jgi:hypothetical protein